MNSLVSNVPVLIKQLGTLHYNVTDKAMHEFTANRQEDTLDEIWIVEHLGVFTQGRAGKAEHIIGHTDIEIVQSDRGGQITYHGPGQLIIYPLIDLKRYKLSIRQFVSILENSLIITLASVGIKAYSRQDAPGVYVDKLNPYIDAPFGTTLANATYNKIVQIKDSVKTSEIKQECKIASLGLRVSRGYTMHGLALNVDMDLSPFDIINPCGLIGMQMTSIAQLLSPCPPLSLISSYLSNEIITQIRLASTNSF
ncbi:lipoyl(octanoyl) transferase LipB [Thorsellia anophelis]|uniref:Octanoyltransferase n=1 Tax=Thorsellia anophelis DSM 18579 TaxID=1123402 RepID=A0A1I0DTM8_9GAMM|nr:lipoyl(octanoyl) transferase LipB [Thorsellia anophelis]SET35559.1 lipoyl(octanoyl) transferase [Thorsellia anophelis DSM 18579]